MSKKSAVVVGAVNMDIWGRSFSPLIARDSNPGELRISLGGVGRNIAHNMRLLDMPVDMLTAIGGDIWAKNVEESCRELGIGLEHAIHVPEARSSTYLYISGPDGDLALGVCDTDIADQITPQVIEKELSFLNNASMVVLDGNLTAEAIRCLCEKCTAPLFADPVSVTKAYKLKPFLRYIHTLKPNSLEAEALTGCSDPEDAAKALLEAGVKRVFVSDGAAGIIAGDESGILRVPCYPAKLVNATGGGDAVMAAICRSFSDGRSLSDSAKYAMAAGAIAIESAETINQQLSNEKVIKRMEEEK